MTHESLSGDSVEATPYKNPRTLGPETQMLNLRILQNLAQNNIYRDETSKEGVRVLERALLGEGRRYKPGEAAAAAQMSLEDARRIWRNMGFLIFTPPIPISRNSTSICSKTWRISTERILLRKRALSL